VYVFDRDGQHIRTIQTNETGNGSIGLGMGAAVSDSGFLYVSDLQNSRVTVFDPDGQFVGYWGGPGSVEGQFVEVDSLAIDSKGRLLLLDYGNQRIQVFELAGPSSATPVATPGSVIRDTFSIGDRSLYLECMGAGSPTVIIEHGQGGAATDMWPLQRELAEDTRVCIYDRAGKGRSDPVPFPRTAAEAVADIHSLLEVAAIPSPYVLIGQSAGGTIVQLFARTYPSEVVGVVAMNAVPPAGPWLEKALPLMTEQERAEEEAFYRGASEGDAFDEAFDWYASFAQLEAAPAPPDVPFLVLISTIAECDRPDDVCGRTHGVYETTMQALAASWPLGRFTQLDTGHEIFYSPDAVSAIRQVIEAARDPSAWAAAAAATPAA
jgi:pimeloyl-ACP methyl ester carboxylesterase